MNYRPLLLALAAHAQRPAPPMEAFPLSAVQLLDSPFLTAQQTDKKYLLALDPDRLLAPYRLEAGLPAPAAHRTSTPWPGPACGRRARCWHRNRVAKQRPIAVAGAGGAGGGARVGATGGGAGFRRSASGQQSTKRRFFRSGTGALLDNAE